MTLTPGRLALTNSLIIFAALALFALFALPLRSAVTLQAVDSDLEAMGDSFAQTPWTSAPVVDVFAPHPMFLESTRLDGTVVIRSANFGAQQLPLDPASLARARSGNSQPSFESLLVDGHPLRSYSGRSAWIARRRRRSRASSK